MHPNVILFDLDGTLSDSAPGILAALRHAFAVTGLQPLDTETERGLLGPPFYDSLPPLIGTAALTDVIEAYRDHYGAEGMYDTALFPGVREIVIGLHEAGVRLAVATSKAERYASPIVEYLGLAGLFETIGGDELDGSRGTKALVIGEVLRRLGSPDPGTVLMIGDRRHDIEGAQTHGIDAIAVGWGYAAPGELVAAQPARICNTAAELSHVLGLGGVNAVAS